jgi:(E)-4-hydroxy-3-methyl-but-2-enyl pyrophosphate reductase
MIVRVAKNAGFCGGVHRAFLMVEKEFKRVKRIKRVLILGSLVHNENVTAKIEQWGIRKIKNLRGVSKGDIVIITAHGVSKERIAKIRSKGAKVFDVTCPNVSKVHKTAADYFRRGYQIIIFGDRKHKEVRGINGWCNNRASIVANQKEINGVLRSISNSKKKNPILFVSQTTQNINQFDQVAEKIKKVAKQAGRRVKVIKTICDATFMRQSEAKNFAKNNGSIVVVGGKKSANTRQLWKIAKKQNDKVIWIDKLDKAAKNRIKKLLVGVKKVAILSGASTPHWDIEETKKYLQSL